MPKTQKIKENTPILQVLQQIKDGTLPPRAVPKEMMALIVGYLSFEGWNHSRIAQLLGFSEKNAQRAHREFEKMIQLVTSVEFVRRKIGCFMYAADNQVAALIGIARDPGTPISEKIAAEASAWKIRVDTVTLLQRLGVLPMQAQKINADVFHHSVELERSPEEMRKLLENIEQEGEEAGVLDEAVKKKIESIRVKIQEVEINRDIVELVQTTEKKEASDEQ
jgi:hypothetical protein